MVGIQEKRRAISDEDVEVGRPGAVAGEERRIPAAADHPVAGMGGREAADARVDLVQ